jgi:hypothetical protein
MAHVIVVDTVWEKAEIETLPEVPLIDQEVIQALLRDTYRMHTILPIAKIELQATSFPATYEATLLDGRTWEQTIQARVPDPGVTFEVDDWWKTSEVSLHRAVRDGCIILLTSHRVTKIELVPRNTQAVGKPLPEPA